MNLTLSNLVRTVSTYFRVGTVRIKDVAGVFSFRNGADSADASIIAAGAKFTTSPGAGKVWTSDAAGVGSWGASPITLLAGDGSDGNVTISSGTTILSRDMYYNSLTLSGSGALVTNGYRVFVAGTWDVANAAVGAIRMLGNNGTGGVTGNFGGGAAGSAGNINTIGGGIAGSAGGNGRNAASSGVGGSAASVTETFNMGGGGGTGGLGGPSSTTGAGNPGSTIGPPVTLPVRRYILDLIYGVTLLLGGGGGSGGGGGGQNGGGGAASGGGGGGAGGAGIIWITANIINRGGSTAVGAILARGGVGGNGASAGIAAQGAGGGGGGGGGGWIYIAYQSLIGSTGTNIVDASGNAGGNAGGVGTTALVAQGGNGGEGGRITLVDLTAGTVTEIVGTGGSPNSGATGGAGEVLRASL